MDRVEENIRVNEKIVLTERMSVKTLHAFIQKRNGSPILVKIQYKKDDVKINDKLFKRLAKIYDLNYEKDNVTLYEDKVDKLVFK